jgi:MFS family permease
LFFAYKRYDDFSPLTVGRLIDRYSTSRVMIPTVCAASRLFPFCCSVDRDSVLLYGVLYGVCVGLFFPLMLTLGMRRAPSGRVGAASATLYLFSDAGFAIGSFVGDS